MMGQSIEVAREATAVPEGGLREAILEHVRERPGTHKSALSRAVGCGWGTVGYHVGGLARDGLVETRSWGGRTRVYPASMGAVERNWFAAVRCAPVRAVLDRLRTSPGRLEEIAEDVGRSCRTTRRHIRTLRVNGLVEQVGVHRPQYRLSRHGEMLLQREARP